MAGDKREIVFYLNENIAVSLVELLSKRGFAAIRTRDVGNLRFSDEQQLRFAADNGYVLVTHNKRHFARLHERWTTEGRQHHGIILLERDEPEILAERLAAFTAFPSPERHFCALLPLASS